MKVRLFTATALIALLTILSIQTLTPATAQDAAKEAPLNQAPEGWTALFNGKDTEGWIIKSGKATYEVVDGAIVGSTVKGSPNTFLTTPKTYGDFELKFDVMLYDNGLNSGVQIRSKVVKEDQFGGRIGGPQVEIEASGDNGAQAGLIYGEAAGGWQSPNAEQRKYKAFKDGQWNQYHIIAKGRRIQTFINGEEIENLELKEEFYNNFKEGVIGLQVHSVGGDKVLRVAWRNIYLKELKGE